jgi:hypothetical protein
MSSPSGRWSISFANSRDWDDGKRSSGFLVFWSAKNWLVLLNDLEDPLVGRSAEVGEIIHVGSIVRFNTHIAKVQDCFFSPWPAKEPAPLCWLASCTSFVNGDWPPQRPAVLLLRPLAKRLVLFDKDDSLIDARYLLEDENVAPGVSIEMPVHKVIVGNLIEEKTQPPQIKIPSSDSSAQVPPPFLDFRRGIRFESDIRRKFGYNVSFVPGFRKREFYLVASFGRANFKLDIHTVSLALQACFGGVAAQFHVKILQARVFRFSVSTRAVGFEIYNSGKFSEKEFDLFVHLWGNGGPNWLFEEKKYYKEQDSEWNLVMLGIYQIGIPAT